MSATNPHKHLYELLKVFPTAMLVTRDADGRMHARPMAIAELEPNADAYFATRIETPKVAEVQNFPDVLVTFQGTSQFALILGKASIVTDRGLIRELWSETWRAWIPDGADDPSLVLIKIEAKEGEYWDNSGAQGLKYLFDGAKAILTGDTIKPDAAQHAKLRLVHG